MTLFDARLTSTDEARDYSKTLGPVNQGIQLQTLSLAGRPKTTAASGNSQTRFATQFVNDPQNKGELRWLSGIITEQETRLNPMKMAPRRLKSGQISTYNVLKSRTTEFLEATGFGFQVPAAAIVTGIEVHIAKHRSRLGSVEDTEVRLIKGSNISGRNQAASGQWPTEGQTNTYGSSDDLWDLALTPQDVNADDFGVAIAVLMKPYDNFQTAIIDIIAISVYWQ